MSDAVTLIKTVFSSTGGGIINTLSAMQLDTVSILLVVFSIITLIIIDRMLTWDDSADGSDMLIKGGSYIYFVWVIAVAWLLLLSRGQDSTFIYFQF